MDPSTKHADRIAGVILGTAVGDALGLPRENMSRRRGRSTFGRSPMRHRFILGCGMISDDSEHTCMAAQALLRAGGDADAFGQSLAWRLRFWLLGLPAGVGFATLRAILKLWLGCSPANSGVHSAGNGPAMRSAILGVCLGDDRDRLRAFVRASSRLTHTDPRAERGAYLVALAAHHAATANAPDLMRDTFLHEARSEGLDSELTALLDQLESHLRRDASAEEFADALDLQRGISGYIYHTVPMALYCWLRYPRDFRSAVEAIIDLGGDTDSTAAIVGALSGATLGTDAIPVEWLNGVVDWPRSVAWMRSLAVRLAPSGTHTPAPLFWPALPIRNTVFLAIVLGHGFRRLLPPY
ncbi:MAG: ADP-ribosylglycohydrolase [Gemmataceae bacterium]|nr:ADP-ribosylglycohydrolase [Gemmataceae bacterium]